jgi:hypothetical protein
MRRPLRSPAAPPRAFSAATMLRGHAEAVLAAVESGVLVLDEPPAETVGAEGAGDAAHVTPNPARPPFGHSTTF